jgi:signal transduction histidine kinase/ActR/RegA family two-component response regulator
VSTLGRIFSRRPLWHQLVLLALATALPLLLSSYLMFNRLASNERDYIRQSLLVNSKTLAALVDTEIDTHMVIAATLSRSPALASGDLKTFWQEATDVLQLVSGSWITVRSSRGEILLSTLVPFGSTFPDSIASSTVLSSFSNKAPQTSDLEVGADSKRLRAVVAVPVFENDKPLYVIEISLAPDRFLALFKDKYTAGEVVGIVDRNHKFVARIPAHDTRVGTLASEDWRAAMNNAAEGIIENRTVEGDWSITGYVPTRNGWTVGVARLEKSIQSPLRSILWSSFAVSFALAALSFVLAVVIARKVSVGMGALTQAAHDVGEGKAIANLPTPFAEANTLANTLQKASTELERRGRALEHANTELEHKVQTRTAELKTELLRREEAEETLRHAQKIETIGQLTGGIAHDFNNMLTVIMGNLDTVQRRMRTIEGTATLNRPIESAQQGARNAAKLTHRLLAFARQQPLEPEALSINSLISGMSDMMSRTVGEQVKIETVLGAGVWLTFADANQLENSLANLIVNARDAMPNGGKLTIETTNTYFDDSYVERLGDVKSGQYVMLSVTDAGTGIDKEKLERIFEPFFTTKGVGKGTGLGLAMVYGFVKQSGGHIRVYSEVGQGTTVKIYLPRHIDIDNVASEPRVASESLDIEPPQARKGETVLLVEDDHAVREYAVSVLEDLGYRVLIAQNGMEGLSVFKKAKRVSLLFTDVVLGGELNGRQLADAIKKFNPTLPVLFTTGYTRNAIVHHGKLDADVNLLNKPYTQRDLALKVRTVIDENPT